MNKLNKEQVLKYSLINLRIVTSLIVIFLPIFYYMRKDLNWNKKIKENEAAQKLNKEELIGTLDSNGIREDVFQFLKKQELSSYSSKVLLEIAKIDQKIFDVYDDKDKSINLYEERVKYITCYMRAEKNKKNLFIIGKLSGVIFNTKNRIDAYHRFMSNTSNNNFSFSSNKAEVFCKKIKDYNF